MCYLGLIACIFLKDYDSFFTGHVARQFYKTGNVTSSNETVEKPKVESVSEGQAEKASISIREESEGQAEKASITAKEE